MPHNEYLKAFMERFAYEGLTFDDISLVTSYADFLPEDADISSKLTSRISINMPFLSAAMDTVTEADMAVEMALLGGVGIIHKNLPIAEQADQVAIVKHHLHGLIRDPIVFKDNQTLEDVALKKRCVKLGRETAFLVPCESSTPLVSYHAPGVNALKMALIPIRTGQVWRRDGGKFCADWAQLGHFRLTLGNRRPI